MDQPPLTDEDLDAFIDSNRWTFAKTMPTIPHYWLTVKGSRDPEEFYAFIWHIYLRGRPMRFRRSNPKWNFDYKGWRYWFMEQHPTECMLVNRGRIEDSEAVEV